MQSCALAGVALAASASVGSAHERTHLLRLQLPDGSVEEIRYVGNVAPDVIVSPAAGDASFAASEQMAALMDRRMNGLLHQAGKLAQSLPTTQAAFGAPGTCMEQVSVISFNGGPPQISTTRSGCGATPAVAPAPRPASGALLVDNGQPVEVADARR